MGNRCFIFLVFCLICLTFFCGCVFNRGSEKVHKILKKSQIKKPDWCKEDYKEDNENYYFSHCQHDKESEIQGLRIAKNKMIIRIKDRTKEQLDIFLSEKINNKEQDIIFLEYNNKLNKIMELDNIIPDNTYYELREKDNQKYYSCYVHKIISKQVLNKKILEALFNLKKKYERDKKMMIILNKIQ